MSDTLDGEETKVFQGPWKQPVDLLRAPQTASSRPSRSRPSAQEVAHGGAGATGAAPARPLGSVSNLTRPPVALPPAHVAKPAPAKVLSPTVVQGPAAAAQPPVRAAVPSASPMFRHEAMRAYSQGLGIAAPLDVAPLASRVLFFTLLALAVSALLVAALGHVELTSLGRGVMRAPEGVQPVLSPVGGVVSEVLVAPGVTVAPAQVLLRIDATQLRAQLLDAERKLAALKVRHAEHAAQAERLHRASVHKLKKRRALIERRIRSQQRGVRRLSERAERFRALSEEGLSDRGAEEEAGEALDGAERAWLALEDQLALADVELSRLLREYQAAEVLRREELERAVSERDAVRLLLEQTDIRAARHGKLEGLRVTAGEVVQPGSPLARIVPSGTPLRVIAFMPERDRAFLREQQDVRLELDRLPVGEFGSLTARVERISHDAALPDEIALHLGEQVHGAFFRVDLTLVQDASRAALRQYLQSGALVTVRAPLRSRRILSLMFDPIRRILD